MEIGWLPLFYKSLFLLNFGLISLTIGFFCSKISRIQRMPNWQRMLVWRWSIYPLMNYFFDHMVLNFQLSIHLNILKDCLWSMCISNQLRHYTLLEWSILRLKLKIRRWPFWQSWRTSNTLDHTLWNDQVSYCKGWFSLWNAWQTFIWSFWVLIPIMPFLTQWLRVFWVYAVLFCLWYEEVWMIMEVINQVLY